MGNRKEVIILKGKTAAVTGGTRGIGFAIVSDRRYGVLRHGNRSARRRHSGGAAMK